MLSKAVVFCFLINSAWSSEERKFPPGFKFGVATAAYQIEGGWNADGKSESIWDSFTHKYAEKIVDHTNGDVACDSYTHWQRDVDLTAELGVDFYRFSVSWTRLMPTGFPDKVSEAGQRYYNNLIDGLIAKGVEPVITLYHWDLPQRLQDLGGWTNPLVVGWFADYARIAFALFGDRVKTWITFNEPILMCEFAYNVVDFAPPISDPGVGDLLCNRHVMLAHATAYRIYEKEFKPKYHGELGLTNHLVWIEADTEDQEELAELARELAIGIYSHPLFSKEGGWPPAIEKIIAENSKREGWPRSRLPAFTQEEKEFIRGSADFYGLNHYSSRVVRKAREGEELLPGWPMFDSKELRAKLYPRPEWPKADTFWFFVYPKGIRNVLSWLKNTYGDIRFFIMENGYASVKRDLNDLPRIKYFEQNLEQILLAIKEDGVNVTGYTAWSLLDNFEWLDGYSNTFGLYHVDFNDPKRTRTARASAKYYSDVIKHRSLDIASQASRQSSVVDEL